MIWIHNAKALAIIAVIFLHTSATILIQSEFNSTQWWVAHVVDSISRWCVPVFIMISGYLLLNPTKSQESIGLFYYKRISKILLPLLFWTVFYLSLSFLKSYFHHSQINWDNTWMTLYYGIPHYHLWYIYMLIGLYIFTPYIRKLIFSLNQREIQYLLATLLFFSCLEGILNYNNHSFFLFQFISYLFYFICGYYLTIYKIQWGIKRCFIVLILSILTTIASFYLTQKYLSSNTSLYFYHYLSINVIIMSIAIFFIFKSTTKYLLPEKFTIQLSNLSLGIYLIHPFFLEQINRFYFIKSTIGLHIFSATIGTIICSLIAVWIFSKMHFLKKII